MTVPTKGFTPRVDRWWLLIIAALIWRALLWPDFFGWEESDYGNLAMARGVLDSGFTAYDMNHLPLYYGLSALVLAVAGNTEFATTTVSLSGGIGALVLAILIARELFGQRAGWIAGICLIGQPEFALYSVSALREPLYACFLLASTYALIRERLGMASLWAGFAFLVRFDALLILGAVLCFSCVRRGFNAQRAARALGPLLSCVAIWMLYCGVQHGTWQFWAHSVAVNLETGGAGNVSGNTGWILQGLSVVWGLTTSVLPQHFSWVLFLSGAAAVISLVGTSHPGVRAYWLTTGLLLGFWLAIGFIGQHEVGHNLYWKWLLPLTPYWAIGAGAVLARVGERSLQAMGSAATFLVAGILLAAMGSQQLSETERQIQLSETLYKPQVELAREIEQTIPEDQVLLVDNIPGCWLNRRPHNRTMWTWMDVPVSGEAFGDWLIAEEIRYVLWFKEDWTQAPRVAPSLGVKPTVSIGSVTLVEIKREDQYGWVWYRVAAPA